MFLPPDGAHPPPRSDPPAAPATARETAPRAIVAAAVRLYRDGLSRSIGEVMEVVAVSGDPAGTLNEATLHAPDVLLLDLGMEGALPLVRELTAAVPATRVVAFAIDEGRDEQVIACVEAGAAGWVGRDASADEVVQAVRRAACGELLCSARTAALLSRRVSDLARERALPPPSPADQLTPREAEIGELLCRGCSNKHIALALGLRIATVKNHVHNILDKLGVRSRGEASALLREGETSSV